MLVFLEVDAFAAEGNSFAFESHALFEIHVFFEFDFAGGSDDALPGESFEVAQDGSNATGEEGIAGGGGDLAIGGDLAFRDGANGAPNGLVAQFGAAERQWRALHATGDGSGIGTLHRYCRMSSLTSARTWSPGLSAE